MLKKALKDRSVDVRLAAALGLAANGSRAGLKVLEKIAARAEEVGVLVAVESRSAFEDMPNEDEMVMLMEEFKDNPWVGYWHDFGHVQRKHNLGLLDHEPSAPLPRKPISAGRAKIQQEKYTRKKDWNLLPKYRDYLVEQNITLIPPGHHRPADAFAAQRDRSWAGIAGRHRAHRGVPVGQSGCSRDSRRRTHIHRVPR